MSRPSDMPRTEQLDAAREEAWNDLRGIANWGGEGVPGHEEGRRIIATARRNDRRCRMGTDCPLHDLIHVVDPTGNSFPVAIAAARNARKANA